MATFLQDDRGNQSSMQLMSLLSLLAGIASGILAVLGRASQDGVLITTMFLLFAFAPKVAQKFIETRLGGPQG